MTSLRETLSLLRVMNRYKEGFAYHKGAQDAKRGLPLAEREGEIARRIEAAYDSVRQVYPEFPCERSTQAIELWLTQKQRRYLGYLAELRDLGEELICNEVAGFYHTDGQLKSQWCNFECRRRDAQNDLEEFDRAFPSYTSRVSLVPWAYYLLLILIGLAELPLNLAAFQLFGEAQLMTAAVALALALIIPAAAHWIGAVIKQPFRTRVDRGMLIVTSLVVLIGILGIGLLREAYLRQMGEEVNHAITLVFIGIQLTLFVGGIIASYNAHDLRHDLEKQRDMLKIAVDNLRRKREAMRRALSASIDGWQAWLNRMRAAYVRGNREAGGAARELGKIELEVPPLPLDEDIPQLTEPREDVPQVPGIQHRVHETSGTAAVETTVPSTTHPPAESPKAASHLTDKEK